MTISHIISSIDKNGGGTSVSSTQLVEELSAQNDNHYYSLYTRISYEPIIEKFKNSNANLFFFDSLKFGFLKGLFNAINSKHHNILHLQGVWDMPLLQAYISSRTKKIPYVISPRGMLEPWSLKQRRLKKNLFRWLITDSIFKNSAVIHATAKTEALNLRKLGFNNPIAVIPNGINF